MRAKLQEARLIPNPTTKTSETRPKQIPISPVALNTKTQLSSLKASNAPTWKQSWMETKLLPNHNVNYMTTSKEATVLAAIKVVTSIKIAKTLKPNGKTNLIRKRHSTGQAF
jgi:hypothetical protein